MNLYEAIKAAVHAAPKTENEAASGWGDSVLIRITGKYATVMATNCVFGLSTRVRMTLDEPTIIGKKGLYSIPTNAVRNAKNLRDIAANLKPGHKEAYDKLSNIIDTAEKDGPLYEMNTAKLATEVADAKDLEVSIYFAVDGETVIAHYEPTNHETRVSFDAEVLGRVIESLGPSEVFYLLIPERLGTPATFLAKDGDSETTIVAMRRMQSSAKYSVSPLLTQHEAGHWLGYVKTQHPAVQGKTADELAKMLNANITYASTEPPFPEAPKDGAVWLGMDFASRLTKRRVAAKALRELTRAVCDLAA